MRPEYFHVEGGLFLTRMRQSEWRRRWGIAAVVVFDGQVAVGGDDGWSHGGFNNGGDTLILGKDAVPNTYQSFARFPNVTIPGGATVQAAYLTVQSSDSSADGPGVKANIYFEDADDAVAPTTVGEHAADVRTTASAAWDDVDFTIDTDTDSPSIVDVVQEILDRGSWSSGNAMMMLLDDDGSDNSSYYIFKTQDEGVNGVKLHVEYTT